MTFTRTCKMALSAWFLCGLAAAPAGATDATGAAPAPLSADNQAQFDAGTRAYDAGDYVRAFEIWLPIAKQGDLAAQRNVAHLLRRGLGVDRDPERALYFYERAARAGLASAALNAGMMRLEKAADHHDTAKAAEWLGLAASAGSPIAHWELSKLLETGDGVAKDEEAALAHLKRAAAAGHVAAQARLAELSVAPGPKPAPAGPAAPVTPEQGAAFMEGVFLFDDGKFEEAARLWLPLAETGVIEAQYRLGRLYRFGLGVPPDLERARYWLTAAASAGHEAAAQAVSALPAPPAP